MKKPAIKIKNHKSFFSWKSLASESMILLNNVHDLFTKAQLWNPTAVLLKLRILAMERVHIWGGGGAKYL